MRRLLVELTYTSYEQALTILVYLFFLKENVRPSSYPLICVGVTDWGGVAYLRDTQPPTIIFLPVHAP